MNSYEHTQDQRLYNKRHKLNYITRYICLINTDINRQSLDKDTKSFDGSPKAVFSN